MTQAEEAYRTAVDAMTPAQKWERTHVWLNWMRDLYARELRKQLGDISEERLRWEVALRQYGSDSQARELIERKLRDVRS